MTNWLIRVVFSVCSFILALAIILYVNGLNQSDVAKARGSPSGIVVEKYSGTVLSFVNLWHTEQEDADWRGGYIERKVFAVRIKEYTLGFCVVTESDWQKINVGDTWICSP